MRPTSAHLDDAAFGRAVERLEALPIRPAVARQVFAALGDAVDPASDDGPPPLIAPIPPVAAAETDPAWALARARTAAARPFDPATLLIDHRWWLPGSTAPPALDALTRLWRHSVAVACAARRLARDGDDPDADRIARAGLLHHLGLWAVASVDPDRLAAWVRADAEARSALEIRWFGGQLSAVGRRLASRLGCDPLVGDAAWLHADIDGTLNPCAADPDRLAIIQRAYAEARRTPWSLDPAPDRDLAPIDPRTRILTAEVQSRCGSPFVDPDASSREERLTRENVRLRRDLARALAAGHSASRLATALGESSPLEDPQTWADRAALAWCQEPGVVAARVIWREPTPPDEPLAGRAPDSTRPIGDPDRPVADLLVWSRPGAGSFDPDPTILAGWDGWARLVADRARVVRDLDRVVLGHRGRLARDERDRRRTLVAGLAEFAAGAGHELNNPLAVIMGRAQLVLARTTDPEATRSLRAIIAQAQRTHRILRDLMFVARPGDFRPRACQPDEIVRASLRDLQDEAEAQGVRLVHEPREPAPTLWADPEPLRQVADILVRNALEASTAGATVRFVTGGDARQVRWTVHDAGRGIAAAEGLHLFDPFFCGRQAGRGLGLGLPRASKIVDLIGGDLRWHSQAGQGATFQVTWPVHPIPAPVEAATGGAVAARSA